jgi:hypothetical protein
MGWLGAEYFRSGPNDPIWSLDGTRQERYKQFHAADRSRCDIARGHGPIATADFKGMIFDWCKTHWIPLFAVDAAPEVHDRKATQRWLNLCKSN